MSKIYQLTKEIHLLISKINQEYGLKIEIKNDFFWTKYKVANKDYKIIDKIELLNNFQYDKYLHKNEFLAIQAPQIRQILIALQEVLGQNPAWIQNQLALKNEKEKIEDCKLYFDFDKASGEEIGRYNDSLQVMHFSEFLLQYHIKELYSEALCDRWLDSLIPLIDLKPETVLQELVEILQTIK